MTVSHRSCQEAVAAGTPLLGDEEAHLSHCAACATFANAVGELDKVAATLAPARTPDGLAERVIAGVGLVGSPPHTIRPPHRYLAVAAVLLLLAAAVTSVVRRADSAGGDDRQAVLLAASRFEKDGPARVSINATTAVDIVAPDGQADFSAAPTEVRDHMTASWEQMMSAFEGQVDRMFDEVGRQIDDAFSGAFGGSALEAPGADSERALPPGDDVHRPGPERPTRASLSLNVRAEGVVGVGQGVQLDGQVEAAPGTVSVPSTSVQFGLDSSASTRAVRTGGSGWVHAEIGAGPLGLLLLDPTAVPAILRSAADDVKATGSSALGRIYRFRVKGAVLRSDAGALWEATVTLGPNNRVRRLALRPVAGNLAVRTTLVIEVAGAGSLNRAQRPTHVGTSVGVDATSPFAPISSAVRAAVRGDGR